MIAKIKITQTLFFCLLFGGIFFTTSSLLAQEGGNETGSGNQTGNEEEIDELKDKLKNAEKKKNNLQGDLSQVNADLSAKQRAINSVAGLVADTEETITRKQNEIGNLEKQIKVNTEILRQLVVELYHTKATPLVEIMLDEADLRGLVSQGDNLLSMQERVGALLEDIAATKEKIKNDQEELANAKDEQESALREHNLDKNEILGDKAELSAELDEQSKVIAKINKELAELQGDLQVVTGKSYSAKNIKDAVNFASDRTGVPKGFLYGVLKVETNLGRNVGGCTYAQVEDGAEKNYKAKRLSKTSYNTFLARRKTFKSITDDLGLNYRKQKVSCNPPYRGTGGAMGVAQFMPDTWVAYRAQIAKVTGRKTPSPWDLTDGVTAMALKLKRDAPGVVNGDTGAMKQATCRYLGVCQAAYYGPVLYWAKNYRQLL
jgi:peptidoglycan hydrolase CwlO-like protein